MIQLSEKEFITNLVPPAPVMGFVQAVHRLANNSPKQLAQYGLSWREANF